MGVEVEACGVKLEEVDAVGGVGGIMCACGTCCKEDRGGGTFLSCC